MTSSIRSARGGTRWLLAIPAALSVLVGVGMWGVPVLRLLRSRGTPAVVVHSTVRSVRGGRSGFTWAPLVDYQYVVNGTAHSGSLVLPDDESRSEAWANDLARRFPVGAHVTAYVDPARPADAFLLRRPSATGYVFVVGPLLFLLLVLGAGGTASSDDPIPPPDPVADGAGRYTLTLAAGPVAADAARRAASARTARRIALVAMVPYVAVALACAAGEGGVGRDVGALWGATFGDRFFLGECLAVAAAAWFLARQRRTAALVAARVRDVTVTLDRPIVRVGEPFTATLDVATIGGGAGIDMLHLGLCRDTQLGGTQRPSSTSAEGWAPIIGRAPPSLPLALLSPPPRLQPPDAVTDATAVRDDGVTATASFHVKPEMAPSSDVAGVRPFTTWAFNVLVSFRDAGTWEVRVPLRVHAAIGFG